MKRKICFITFGPIESQSNGYFIRAFSILKEVSKKNQVLVMEFDERDKKGRVKLNPNTHFIRLKSNRIIQNKLSKLMIKFFTFNPLHILKFQIFSFFELLKNSKKIQSSDIVMVEGSLILNAIFIAKIFKKKIILDTHCINKLLAKKYKKNQRFIYYLRYFLWDLIERVTIRLSDVIITVSDKEKQFVVKEYNTSESKVFVVPNVVKLPRKISKTEIRNLRKLYSLSGKIVVTFVGVLSSIQNADAVRYILSEIAPWFLKRDKNVVFLIVGGGGDFNTKLPNVIFTGYVKELAPILGMSDICIAPLRVGAGVKTKILEYLAYNKPIVATPIAMEGISDYPKQRVKVVAVEEFKNALLNFTKQLKDTNKLNSNAPILLGFNFIKNLNKTFEKKLTKVMEAVKNG